eukprot:6370756-Amphidinium_carterae.1
MSHASFSPRFTEEVGRHPCNREASLQLRILQQMMLDQCARSRVFSAQAFSFLAACPESLYLEACLQMFECTRIASHASASILAQKLRTACWWLSALVFPNCGSVQRPAWKGEEVGFHLRSVGREVWLALAAAGAAVVTSHLSNVMRI